MMSQINLSDSPRSLMMALMKTRININHFVDVCDCLIIIQRKPQLTALSSVLPNDTPVFDVCKPRFQEK